MSTKMAYGLLWPMTYDNLARYGRCSMYGGPNYVLLVRKTEQSFCLLLRSCLVYSLGAMLYAAPCATPVRCPTPIGPMQPCHHRLSLTPVN
jgi:hypothetical protein